MSRDSDKIFKMQLWVKTNDVFKEIGSFHEKKNCSEKNIKNRSSERVSKTFIQIKIFIKTSKSVKIFPNSLIFTMFGIHFCYLEKVPEF